MRHRSYHTVKWQIRCIALLLGLVYLSTWVCKSAHLHDLTDCHHVAHNSHSESHAEEILDQAAHSCSICDFTFALTTAAETPDIIATYDWADTYVLPGGIYEPTGMQRVHSLRAPPASLI